MAESKTTELSRIESKSYAITEYDEDALREIVEINLGGEKSITEFDLTRAKIPSGGGIAFNVEGPEGESAPTEIVGVIVCHQSRRTYWAKGIDEGEGGGPPDCWSPNGIVGHGTEAEKVGGQCARCPKSQFGSGMKDGRPTKGQACNQRKALFIIQKDSILPIYLSLPPTSLGSLKSYLTGLIGRRLPITGVVTKITLGVAKNSGGTKYAEAKFSLVGTLDEEATRKFTAFGRMFDSMFRPQIPGAEDFGQRPVVATVNGTPVEDKTAWKSGAKTYEKPETKVEGKIPI
jgi:hypothetical protein